MTKRGKDKHGGGWWHDSTTGHFSDIYYLIDEPRNIDSFGPFATYGEAKRDAIGYHQCDLDNARMAINAIRTHRKPMAKKETP